MLKRRLSGMKKNLPFLKHIRDEINFLLKETKGVTFESFIANESLKRASTRSFEIIGEAVKNLSCEFKSKHKNIDWKKIAGMRDKIIHYYFGVDYNILWQAIKDKVPSLKLKIESIIKKIEK